jgi:hypothetical protein
MVLIVCPERKRYTPRTVYTGPVMLPQTDRQTDIQTQTEERISTDSVRFLSLCKSNPNCKQTKCKLNNKILPSAFLHSVNPKPPESASLFTIRKSIVTYVIKSHIKSNSGTHKLHLFVRKFLDFCKQTKQTVRRRV